MKPKLLDPTLTNVELVGENVFKATGVFKTDYSEEFGSFEIPKIKIDLSSILLESIDCDRGVQLPRTYSSRASILLDTDLKYVVFKFPPEPPIEITIDDIEKKFGRKVKIISK